MKVKVSESGTLFNPFQRRSVASIFLNKKKEPRPSFFEHLLPHGICCGLYFLLYLRKDDYIFLPTTAAAELTPSSFYSMPTVRNTLCVAGILWEVAYGSKKTWKKNHRKPCCFLAPYRWTRGWITNCKGNKSWLIAVPYLWCNYLFPDENKKGECLNIGSRRNGQQQRIYLAIILLLLL